MGAPTCDYHAHLLLPCRSSIGGGCPFFARLTLSNRGSAAGMTGPLGRIIERLRQRWPELQVLIRADSALRPRGVAGLVRGQRRGLRHRPRPQRPGRQADRPGVGRRQERDGRQAVGVSEAKTRALVVQVEAPVGLFEIGSRQGSGEADL